MSRSANPGRKEDYVSVVVPACNEEGNIPLLYALLCEVLQGIEGLRWELILVDDGSRDRTWAMIGELAATDLRVRGVRLSRNFGHQYALMAGMEMAGGEALIMMDCDLQHPAEMLPLMIEKWRAGCKVVKTMRQEDAGGSWFKQFTSRNFYRFFSWLSGVALQPGLADFRLLDRQPLNELLRFGEQGLFLRGLVEWIGYPSCILPYQPGKRVRGRSQYSLKKMLSFAWKGISSFSLMPLRIGMLAGLVGSVVSFLGILYAILGKIFGSETVPGWASTLMVLSLLFSLLFFYLGILGEYVGRIVVEVQRRPRFIISETEGFEAQTPVARDCR